MKPHYKRYVTSDGQIIGAFSIQQALYQIYDKYVSDDVLAQNGLVLFDYDQEFPF